MVIELKLKIKEARITVKALNKLLVEKDRENENPKLEVVSLRKKSQENNINHNSQILNQIINSQRSTNDQSRISYKAAVTNVFSSSGFEKIGTEEKKEKGIDKKTVSKR